LKAAKISHKVILCVVLGLLIVGAFLVPATTVTAAPQDWPLTLVGATTATITKAQFEAMAAATPSNTFMSSDNHTWKGVALWRLIALVDDGDPTTFNASLVGTYSIKLEAADGYSKTVAPPYTNFAFQSPTEDLFVANKVMLAGTTEWIDLPMTKPGGTSMWYPLMDTGSGIGMNNLRVSALVKITLLNLPVSSVSVSPASQAVANGASFAVSMAINTNTASRGWQMNVNFDASRLVANSVAEGTFLSDYAIANGGGTVSAGAATIDNVGGTITIPGYAITGAGTGGQTGSGTLCTVSFTAKASVDNFASITPSAVVIADVNGIAIPGTSVSGGTVAIGNVPMPDLVVSALSTTKVDDATYTITYTINNQGNAAAAATTTSVVVDAGAPVTIACPALAAGASDTQTTAAQTYSSPNDAIVVTADSTGAVSESNEGNNTKGLIYAKAGDQGDTPITSGIDAILVLDVPDPITWQLHWGSNAKTGAANVKCNTPWQLQVSDQDPTTGGYMTPWDGSSYVAGNKLANAMQVGCQTGPFSLPAGGTIATGVVAGQNGDNGQDLTVNFSQQVLFSDQANGVTYHIVVTFTASSSF
jgi:CARDB